MYALRPPHMRDQMELDRMRRQYQMDRYGQGLGPDHELEGIQAENNKSFWGAVGSNAAATNSSYNDMVKGLNEGQSNQAIQALQNAGNFDVAKLRDTGETRRQGMIEAGATGRSIIGADSDQMVQQLRNMGSLDERRLMGQQRLQEIPLEGQWRVNQQNAANKGDLDVANATGSWTNRNTVTRGRQEVDLTRLKGQQDMDQLREMLRGGVQPGQSLSIPGVGSIRQANPAAGGRNNMNPILNDMAEARRNLAYAQARGDQNGMAAAQGQLNQTQANFLRQYQGNADVRDLMLNATSWPDVMRQRDANGVRQALESNGINTSRMTAEELGEVLSIIAVFRGEL